MTRSTPAFPMRRGQGLMLLAASALAFTASGVAKAAPAPATVPALAAAASPSAAACDRACLGGLVDRLLASITAHDPASMPLAPIYRATENGVPGALPMLTIWHTVSAAHDTFKVIDTTSGQIFFITNITEGDHHALFFGRIKAQGSGAQVRASEIELYVNRSRSDGGFMFGPEGLGHLPAAWTDAVAPSRLLSRAELKRAGQSIFDTSIEGPPPSSACRMMENGTPVAEDPEVLEVVGGGGPHLPANPDGSVPIPCGAPPFRPTDPDARTDIVDTEQGTVISLGTMEGLVQPYLITDPTTSAFVPDAMGQPYRDLLKAQRATGRYGKQPELAPTPASITVAQVQRYYDGKLQGMLLLQKIGPIGGRSPWTGAAAKE